MKIRPEKVHERKLGLCKLCGRDGMLREEGGHNNICLLLSQRRWGGVYVCVRM